MDDGMFDPEKLKWVGPAVPPIAPASSPKPFRIKRSQHPFFKIPYIWSDTLATIPDATAATYRLALHLIREGWKSPNHVVKLTNAAGVVSRWTKYRELPKLRNSGLIEVEERVRKSPLVTVRYLD
jgi:hypothetical protein